MRAVCGCLIIGMDDSGFVIEFCNLHHVPLTEAQTNNLLMNLAFPKFSVATH